MPCRQEYVGMLAPCIEADAAAVRSVLGDGAGNWDDLDFTMIMTPRDELKRRFGDKNPVEEYEKGLVNYAKNCGNTACAHYVSLEEENA